MDTEMYLVFDTETTNLPSSSPEHDPMCARIQQLALLLLDEEYKELESFVSYVKLPKHTIVTDGAFNRHHISKEICDTQGKDIQEVLAAFQSFLAKSKYQIAHALKFDYTLLASEFSFAKLGVLQLSCPVDTMLSSTDVCKIRNKWGKYKWPKLSEVYQFLFHETFDNAHDAMADVRATARVFRWLKEHQIVK